MASLNTLTCQLNSGNTGIGACYLNFKFIVGAIIAPKGYEFDVTTPQSTLSAAALNATKSLRVYPLYDFEAITDASEPKTIQTLGNGSKAVVREGFNDWTFQFRKGGLSLTNNLRKFNGDAWDFYFVDSDNKIMGIAGSTSTKLKAIPTTGGFIWTGPWKPNDGSKVTEYMIQFLFNQKYSMDLVNYVEAGFDVPSLLYGLQDVVVTAVTGGTTGHYNVTAKTGSIGANLGDLYPVLLASPSMWSVVNSTTNAAVTITGVVYDAVNKVFQLTLDTSDTDWTGATSVIINLVAPATLDAAGVTGLESTGGFTIAKN